MSDAHPWRFALSMSALVLVSCAVSAWALVRAIDTQSSQIAQNRRIVRIQQRIIHDERPTEKQLVQAIVHALAVCHASPTCSKQLEQAKRGLPPQPKRTATSPSGRSSPPTTPVPALPSPPASRSTGTPTGSPKQPQPRPHPPSPSPQPSPPPGPLPLPPLPPLPRPCVGSLCL